MAVPASDVVIAFGSVAASIGMSGFFAYRMWQTPEEYLTSFGFKDTDKESLFPVVVNSLRMYAVASAFKALVAFYLLVLSCANPGLWATTVTFVLLWNLASMIAPAFRFYEDPKSPRNNAASIAAAEQFLKTVAPVAIALVFAEFMLWWYSEAGTNYVHDALHGLPEDLTFVKSHAKNFLQHHLRL
ncbi:unnamed protein product [Amoebophrya sp. A25]|nr:unnamed protein product [Amoebophrya sp. A25]|eukprot:GSA25T00012505001.1